MAPRARTHLRGAGLLAALLALAACVLAVAAPTAHAKKRKAAKGPVVTALAPKAVAVGETLTIRGRNFRVGRFRNTVVWKRAGARAVFSKARIGTRKLLKVRVPASLQEFFSLRAGVPVPTRFRVRVLSGRLGKAFTPARLSPVVSGRRPARAVDPAVAAADGDCDGDGALNRADADDDNDVLTDEVELSLSLDPCKPDTDGDGVLDRWEFDCDRDGFLNRDESDDDGDLLDDAHETRIATNPCSLDSDGDGVEDGYEYRSAVDLNDDDYQNPNASLPFPAKRPYPNPMFADAGIDYDGDSLTLADEQALWKYTLARFAPRDLAVLTYSDGKQFSRNISAYSYRQAAAAAPAGVEAVQAPAIEADLSLHKQWAFLVLSERAGYPTAALLDVNGARVPADGAFDGLAWPTTWVPDPGITDLEAYYHDYDHDGRMRDDELDEDGDGLGNWDEAHGFMQPDWWKAWYPMEAPYPVPYAGTRLDDADSDGDGVLDGADDQDHDDVANVRELSRRLVAGEARDGSPWIAGQDPGTIQWIRTLENPFVPPPGIAQPRRAWVNPFNPCLPDAGSRTCLVRVPHNGPAPFTTDPADVFHVFN